MKNKWEALRTPYTNKILFNHPDIMKLEDYELCESHWKYTVLDYFEKRLTIEYVRKVMAKFLKDKLDFIEAKRKELYQLNDKLRESGQSFKDRTEPVFSRLEVLNQMQDDTELWKKGFTMLPLEGWLVPDDVRDIKKVGLNRFITLNFERFLCQQKV